MISARLLQKAAALRNLVPLHRISQHPTSRLAAFTANNRFTMSNPKCTFSTGTELPLPPTSNHPHSKLASAQGSLIYTETDEAPALATYSLLPILKKVCLLDCWLIVDGLFVLLPTSNYLIVSPDII